MYIIDEDFEKANWKEKDFWEGNHEDWLQQTVNEHPYLPQYRVRTAIKLD